MLTWLCIALLCAYAMAANCPTTISEGCPPNANCAASVCGANATCPAWQGQTTTNCCSYLCGTGTTAPATCFAKWFDNTGNALNCDVCAGAQCQNRTQIEATCASQYGQYGYDLIQPNSTARRCCLTCQPKPFTCPSTISEGCPPSASCNSTVCGANANCPAWDGQRLTHCCPYQCSSGCFAKWFDNSANALNCDVCAGAQCQNRTQIEAGCAAQYGANGYDLIQPDSSKRRCCYTCQAKATPAPAYTCPQVIAEGCPPSANCSRSVCPAGASCPAWDGQRETHCCSYQCANGCFAKWFDTPGNALNCDICAGAQCQNRTQIEAGCAAQYGANGYDLIQPNSTARRCCLTCQAKPYTCPQNIAEGCPPSANCSSAVCPAGASCPAWDGQRETHCCSYQCANGCFAKWFDTPGNALNCDICAGAQCQNRTQIEAGCAAQYGTNGYDLIQPDSSKRRCCVTCQAKAATPAPAYTCPTVIAEGCAPSANCSSSVCPTSASCPAWDGQRETHCCSYQCANGCFAKWFDTPGNALNCDICAGAQCQNRTQIEASCAAQYGANGYDLIQPDSSKRRCCVTCQAKGATPAPAYTCPTVIAEGCPPSANCSSSVCPTGASCPAWDGQRETHCCSYACNDRCLAKWFDTPGNVLNCDICAGAQCQNRTQIEAGCVAQYGANNYELIQPDSSKRRCCLTCAAAVSGETTSSSGSVDGTTSSESNQDSTAVVGGDTTSGEVIEKSGMQLNSATVDNLGFAAALEASLALILVVVTIAFI